MFKISSLLVLGLTFCAGAAELPPLRIPENVGINIHFTGGHEHDLDLIAAAGIRVVRMDFGWAGIERKKGEYDWSEYDALTADLEKRGLRPYYILDYSNPLYEETVTSKNPVNGREQRDVASPQDSESIEAFARWAAEAVKHYHGHSIIWEIWNEPNISFWKPKPDAAQYTALALATCKSIRAADSDALIVGPATSQLPMKFMEEFLQSGVLNYLSAVSFHPYRNYNRPPESAVKDYKKLRGLIERFAPAGKTLPIISGEWGYASHDRGVSLDKQARFVVRQQLSNLLAGVPVSVWYDWKNDGTNPAEREENFGIVADALEPKPAYLALQTMTRELNGYRIVRELKINFEDARLVLFINANGTQKLAGWTLEEPRHVTIPVSTENNASVSITFAKNKTVSHELKSNNLSLGLISTPQYIELSRARIE